MPKDNWPEKIEQAIREALANVPGLDNLTEDSYCEVVLEGLDLVSTGIQMRLDELNADEDDAGEEGDEE